MKTTLHNQTIKGLAVTLLASVLTLAATTAREASRDFNAGNGDLVGVASKVEFIETVGDPYEVTLKAHADSKLLGVTRRVLEGQSKLSVDGESRGLATGFIKAHGETVREWNTSFTAAANWSVAPVTVAGVSVGGNFLGFEFELGARLTASATGRATVRAQRGARPIVSASISPVGSASVTARLGATLPFGIASASIAATGNNGRGSYSLFNLALNGSAVITPRSLNRPTLISLRVGGTFQGPVGRVVVNVANIFGRSTVPLITWNAPRITFTL